MARNFKVCIGPSGDVLKLRGDFDGSSALELLNILQKDCKHISKAFIDTTHLQKIHPFGKEVLHRNLRVLRRQSLSIVFTGDKASLLAPAKGGFAQPGMTIP